MANQSGASMTFDTATSAPPKTGELRMDAADPRTVAHLFLSDTAADGADVYPHTIARVFGDLIRITDPANATNTLTYTVTAAPIDASKYVDLPVVFVSGSGAAFSDQQPITVTAGAAGWRPDSGAIDRAIIAVLQNDPALIDLCPGGVWFDIAAPGLTRFVLVGVDRSVDEGVFGHRGIESLRYDVQAVGLSRDASLGDMKAAAARIDALLDGDPLEPPPDYASIDCVRDERLATTVVDELDKSLSWHHYGGYYMVTAAWPD